MRLILLIILVIISLLHQGFAVESSGEIAPRKKKTADIFCEIVGDCVSCNKEEIDKPYCKDTGRRMRIHCKDAQSEFDDYKSCMRTSEDEQMRVVVFQVVMGILGGIAYWGVQLRKKNSMTLFDHRKQRFAAGTNLEEIRWVTP
eukprot:gene27813-33588_t